jgi:hypothetical protein
MIRSCLVLVVLLVGSAAVQAQQAYCDCCGQLYSPPGAKWIGADRNYGGLCENCRGKCEDCRDQPDAMRRDYKTWDEIRYRAKLTASGNARLDWRMDRARQRWADLRYSCLAGGGRDIGRMDPDRPDMPPSRGLATPDTKRRLRDQVRQVWDRFEDQVDAFDSVYGDDPSVRQVGLDAVREFSRTADLLDRLANDPPDPDFEKVVMPVITSEPKEDGSAKDTFALRRSNVAQKNSNAYFDAYITSFERYQAAQKAGNKEAAKRQVEAMGTFSHSAEAQARLAAVRYREFERVLLKRIDDRRAELAKKGIKWQDDLKARQEKVRDRWPADLAKALEGAKVPAKQSDALRKRFLSLTPDDVEKRLADRRATIEIDDAAAAAAAKNASPITPEPPHLEALLLMEHQAHLLHAELAGRKRDLPKDNPFPAPKDKKK